MEYKIRHEERLIGFYYVEAASEEEALEKFDAMVRGNDVDAIDLSDMEMLESSDSVVSRDQTNSAQDHTRLPSGLLSGEWMSKVW